MQITLFAGDVCDVRAEALCTSTNPRLSLMMGTGAAVRGRGGPRILRQCEAIVEAELSRTGKRGLPPGSAHGTTAGDLPAKLVIHCVASDGSHRSSPDIVRSCTRSALAAADAADCATIAMPVFGSGHAGVPFKEALVAMASVLRDVVTEVRRVFIVVFDRERAAEAVRVIESVLPSTEIDLEYGPAAEEESIGMWSADWGEHYGR